jgi:hypothetical protein
MSAAHTANLQFAGTSARQEHLNRWKGGMSLLAYFAAGATVNIRGSSKQGATAAETTLIATLAPAAGNSFLDVQANLVNYWDYLWVDVSAAAGPGYLTISGNNNGKF